MTPLAINAIEEIKSLHAALLDLFTGRSRDFKRCANAFAADLSMITPDGVRLDRTAILASFKRATAAPDFRITINDIRLIGEWGDSVLLQYVEEQYRDCKTTRRLSTALLTAEAKAPCGVVWRYLHETWMQDAESHQEKSPNGATGSGA
jgi:hypothetical protein